MRKFGSTGCLVTPLWRSAVFWTFLYADGVHFHSYVRKVFSFCPNFVTGEYIRNTVFKGVQKFKTLALRVDFENVEPAFCIYDGCRHCLV